MPYLNFTCLLTNCFTIGKKPFSVQCCSAGTHTSILAYHHNALPLPLPVCWSPDPPCLLFWAPHKSKKTLFVSDLSHDLDLVMLPLHHLWKYKMTKTSLSYLMTASEIVMTFPYKLHLYYLHYLSEKYWHCWNGLSIYMGLKLLLLWNFNEIASWAVILVWMKCWWGWGWLSSEFDILILKLFYLMLTQYLRLLCLFRKRFILPVSVFLLALHLTAWPFRKMSLCDRKRYFTVSCHI